MELVDTSNGRGGPTAELRETPKDEVEALAHPTGIRKIKWVGLVAGWVREAAPDQYNSGRDLPDTGGEGVETLDNPAGVRRVERVGRNAGRVRKPELDLVQTE
jgi:hypothetical protein